ncbi:alpha-2-macroglobulin-like protein 1 isoform X1 [Rhinoraja longicauda]
MDRSEMAAGILFSFLLGVVGAAPHTLVLIPSEIQLGSPERLCVVQPAGEGGSGGSLKVTMFYARANTTLIQLDTQDIGAHGCIQFTAPEVDLGNDWDSVATVTVIGSGELSAINITKKVLLKKYHSLSFVQTDKPVYKPGQTVRFRVVSLDQDFQPTLEKYSRITLSDLAGNRIGQWLDVESRQGIVDLSFDLIPDAPLGSYEIQVQKSSGKVSHRFMVDEYVLPKFELKVHLPKTITILDTTIPVKVCGRYTYGKPMRGDVNGTVCLQPVYIHHSHSNCHIVTGKTDADGCFSRDLSTDIFRIRTNWRHSRNINVHFVVSEEGTGIRREGWGNCQVSSEVTTIRFEEVENYYKTGIPYTGKVRCGDVWYTPTRGHPPHTHTLWYTHTLGHPPHTHTLWYTHTLGHPPHTHTLWYTHTLGHPPHTHTLWYTHTLGHPPHTHTLWYTHTLGHPPHTQTLWYTHTWGNSPHTHCGTHTHWDTPHTHTHTVVHTHMGKLPTHMHTYTHGVIHTCTLTHIHAWCDMPTHTL